MTVGNRDCSTGHVLPDYFNLLPRGLNYYKAQCQKKIDETVIDSQEKQNQIDFWNAVIISIDAAGAFAKRYSDLALELSKTEKDEKRKAELLEIAEVCAHVPLEPARTFHEAIQFVWFMHVIMNIENNGHGESLHRFDQYMNPYYVADKAAGRITEDEAIELIQCFFIKMTDVMKLRDKFYSQSFAGLSPVAEHHHRWPDPRRQGCHERDVLPVPEGERRCPDLPAHHVRALLQGSERGSDSGGTEDDPGRYGHPRVLQR